MSDSRQDGSGGFEGGSASGSYEWSPQRNPTPYDHLVARCSSIVAVPATIDVSPPFSVRYGGIGVVAKINRHVYVGIEPIEGNKPCRIGGVWHYRPETHRYESWESNRRERLEVGLYEALKDETRRDTYQIPAGLGAATQLYVVSELPFYRGLNLDATVATGVATALLLYAGRLSPSDVERFARDRFESLRKDPAYQSLFALAWRLETLLSKYRPEGHQIHSVLTKTDGCTFFWRDSVRSPTDVQSLFREDPFDFHPWGCRFDELVIPARENLANEPTAFAVDPLGGFDVAAIFFGREADSEDVYAAHRKGYRKRVDDAAALSMKAIPPASAHESSARFLRLSSSGTDGAKLSKSEPTTATDRLMDVVVVKSMETFSDLALIAERGLTPGAIRGLVMSMDHAHDLYRLLDLSAGFIDEACHLLRHELRELTRQKVAARLMGPGRGGCLLTFAARGSLAAALPVALAAVRDRLRLAANLPIPHWESFREGYAPAGLRVLQQRKGGEPFYCSFQPDRNLRVREWTGGRAGSDLLFDKRAWAEKRKDYDVVLEFDDEPFVWLHGQPRSDTLDSSKETTLEPESSKELEVAPKRPGRAGKKSGPPWGSSPAAPAPGRARLLLNALFSQAHASSEAVFMSAEVIKNLMKKKDAKPGEKENKAYDDGYYVRNTVVVPAVGPQVVGLCGIKVKQTEPRMIKKGGYTLMARPESSVRVALVWRWPPR